MNNNILKIKSGDYVNVPARSQYYDPKDPYYFDDDAFTVMASITPKKTDPNGKTVLTQGSILSNALKTVGSGWTLYVRKDEEEGLVLGFSFIAFGTGFRYIEAHLNNMYDDKANRNSTGSTEDFNKSFALFNEYTHCVAAVIGKDGELRLYANGYLLAKVSSLSSGTCLHGLFKESIDQPNQFFFFENSTNGTVGVSGHDADSKTPFGKIDSTLYNYKQTVKLSLENGEQDKYGVSSLIAEKESQKFKLYAIPKKGGKEKLLATYFSNLSYHGKARNTFLNIGKTDHIEEFDFEGFIKNVSLWNIALTHDDIISHMHGEKEESENINRVAFWKLENNFIDNAQLPNHGNPAGGSPEFVYQNQVLPVYVQEQQKTNWCWAATALAVTQFYDPRQNITQKNIVDTQVTPPKEGETKYGDENYDDQPGSSDRYLRLSGLLKASYNRELQKLAAAVRVDDNSVPSLIEIFADSSGNEIIDFKMLQYEINNGRPVCVAVRWWDPGHKGVPETEGKQAIPEQPPGFNAGGHIMVLSGINHETQELIINDPWSGIINISIENLLRGKYPNKGYWYKAFTTKSKNAL